MDIKDGGLKKKHLKISHKERVVWNDSNINTKYFAYLSLINVKNILKIYWNICWRCYIINIMKIIYIYIYIYIYININGVKYFILLKWIFKIKLNLKKQNIILNWTIP